MAQLCPGCRSLFEGPSCPHCEQPRDLRAEAFVKAVGFWLMALSMFLVLAWIVFPLLRDFYRRETVGWAFLLFFSALILWLGRSLYRLGDGARILLAGLCFLGCGVTLLTGCAMLSIGRRVIRPEFLLWTINAVLWGAIGAQLVRTPAERVCSRPYRERYGTAQPIARFYTSLWFWALFAVHGALVAWLTYSIWQDTLR